MVLDETMKNLNNRSEVTVMAPQLTLMPVEDNYSRGAFGQEEGLLPGPRSVFLFDDEDSDDDDMDDDFDDMDDDFDDDFDDDDDFEDEDDDYEDEDDDYDYDEDVDYEDFDE